MLSKAIQFFKRYWVFVLLAAVASGLIMLRLSQRGQPPLPGFQPRPTPQPTVIKPTITGFKIPPSPKLTLTDFSFPSQLKTYQGQESKISPDEAIKIAQEFNFSQPPRKSEDISLGRFYTWASATYSLSIGLDASQISYGLDLYQTQPPTQGALPSPEAAKATLENLLARLDLTPDFESEWQKEKYEEVDFIRVGFNPALDHYQLIGFNPHEPLVSLALGKEEEIIYFRYQVYFSGFVEKETYELKTKEEVQKTLTTEGKIVYAGTFKKTTKEPDFIQASFNQIQLAYFQDPEKALVIQPIYILTGKGTLANKEETEIIAYLPAISSKWLKLPREHFRF